MSRYLRKVHSPDEIAMDMYRHGSGSWNVVGGRTKSLVVLYL